MKTMLNIFKGITIPAKAVEGAINKVLDEGYRTIDIMPAPGKDTSSIKQVGTAVMGDLIVERL